MNVSVDMFLLLFSKLFIIASHVRALFLKKSKCYLRKIWFISLKITIKACYQMIVIFLFGLEDILLILTIFFIALIYF